MFAYCILWQGATPPYIRHIASAAADDGPLAARSFSDPLAMATGQRLTLNLNPKAKRFKMLLQQQQWRWQWQQQPLMAKNHLKWLSAVHTHTHTHRVRWRLRME